MRQALAASDVIRRGVARSRTAARGSEHVVFGSSSAPQSKRAQTPGFPGTSRLVRHGCRIRADGLGHDPVALGDGDDLLLLERGVFIPAQGMHGRRRLELKIETTRSLPPLKRKAPASHGDHFRDTQQVVRKRTQQLSARLDHAGIHRSRAVAIPSCCKPLDSVDRSANSRVECGSIRAEVTSADGRLRGV